MRWGLLNSVRLSMNAADPLEAYRHRPPRSKLILRKVIALTIDGFVKVRDQSLRIPRNTAIAGAEGGVLTVRRNDEGYI